MTSSTGLGSGAVAFFDIDGTLLLPPSLESQFRRFLRWRGDLRARQQLHWFRRFLADVWRNPLAATHGNKFHYAGVRLTTMEAWLSLLRRHPLPFYAQAVDLLTWHAQQGHRIVLVSGAIRPLAGHVAESINSMLEQRLSVRAQIEVLAAELEVRDGRFTGKLAGRAMCGAQKARAIEALAAEHNLDLAASFAYGNSVLDQWMLARVGHPAAVNPSILLEWLARRRGWPILRWSNTSKAHRNATSVMRTNPASLLQENPR